MNSEPAQWSEEKLKSLQEHLVGRWAEDIWIFAPSNRKHSTRYLRFTLSSPSLKTEIKYAIWSKFDTGKCKMNASQSHFITTLSYLIDWLNLYTPPIQSLMEKTLEEWEMSFRDYLIRTGGLRKKRILGLSTTQEYVEYIREDRRIIL